MGNHELQATHGHTPILWHNINWAKCYRKVRSLQRRIVKAIRAGNWRKAKRLLYLLVKSCSARALAVKRVTENSGKKTAGIDGVLWNTPRLKSQAIEIIGNWKGYCPSPLKRIYIPKKDKRRKRPLSIPSMEDRARQALYLQGLNPIAEEKGDRNSYGFRPKRQCADAIDQCFKVLRLKNSATYILEADIKSFYDHISFQWLLDKIPMNKKVLEKWLKSGFMEKGSLFPTIDGVPQGGVASPVISNMVLDGLEDLVRGTTSFRKANSINFIRYADDFIVTANNRKGLEEIVIPKINDFLKPRGVALSEEKTKITHITEGFDFLGQTIRKFKRKSGKIGKIQIFPSQKSLKAIKARIKDICKSSVGLSAEQLIGRLNPVLRGWANYHRHVICSDTFSEVDHYVWKRLYRWAKRRHPNKTGAWLAKRYFTEKHGRKWTFWDRKSQKTLICIQQAIKHQEHVKIKADANPFTKEWDEYFKKRDRNLKEDAVTEFKGMVLARQKGICPGCHQVIEHDEEIDLHHKDGNHSNNQLANVVFVHPNCHRQIHHTKDRKCV